MATLVQVLLQIDEYDNAELCGNTGQSDETHARCDEEVVVHQVQKPDTSREGERQGSYDQADPVDTPKGQVQQDEDEQQGDWHHDLQARTVALWQRPARGNVAS